MSGAFKGLGNMSLDPNEDSAPVDQIALRIERLGIAQLSGISRD